jgi:hypothetical protein
VFYQGGIGCETCISGTIFGRYASLEILLRAIRLWSWLLIKRVKTPKDFKFYSFSLTQIRIRPRLFKG